MPVLWPGEVARADIRSWWRHDQEARAGAGLQVGDMRCELDDQDLDGSGSALVFRGAPDADPHGATSQHGQGHIAGPDTRVAPVVGGDR